MGVLIELMPLRIYTLSSRPEAFNHYTPGVYKTIAKNPDIDNIIILRSRPEKKDDGFPFTRTEDVLWAGYHNKNIFNGYSGYEPTNYGAQMADFIDLGKDDLKKMKDVGLKYVLIDKSLTPNDSHLYIQAHALLGKPIDSDERYILYKL